MIGLKQVEALAEALGRDALGGMIDSVCAGLERALADLEDAGASGEMAALTAIAHAVRGRVAMFGCHALADGLANVERAASVGMEAPEINRRIDELRPVAQATVSALSAYRARPVDQA